MTLPIAYLLVGALGSIAGAGLILAFTSGPEQDRPADVEAATARISNDDIAAAVAADPSLCASAEREIPTASEAQAAFLEAKGFTFPEVAITIGQCDRDTMGAGVACMSRIVWGPGGKPAERLVGFARSPDGWVATLY